MSSLRPDGNDVCDQGLCTRSTSAKQTSYWGTVAAALVAFALMTITPKGSGLAGVSVTIAGDLEESARPLHWQPMPRWR